MTSSRTQLRYSSVALVVLFIALSHWSADACRAQTAPVGIFSGSSDVGKVNKPGSTVFDEATGRYTLTGSGTNMWADHDEYQFAWTKLTGNFIVTTRAQFAGKGVEAHRKIGWIARPSLDPDSPQASAVLHGDGLTSLQFRRARGVPTEQVESKVKAPDVLQLERRGDKLIMSVAHFGEPFSSVEVADLKLGDDVYVGLFVCAHNNNVLEQAIFSDVRVTVPPADGYTPYKDYIGSKLELMDVATGTRKVVYTTADSMQAPNWTKDGKALIFNRNGRLYGFDLAGKTATEINTDFAVNNNNDHVLSFNGKWLAISNHSKEDQNRSVVYVMPSGGGKPTRVTPSSPSYLHGWSPDGKYLYFTGGRDGNYDIYKIPVAGGAEQRMTTDPGLDDGPEFTADGKYIYFNSSRSGRMQVWRMQPDGSGQEQITHDDFNNWFPHPSPDGKWIVFITFENDISPTDHPFYKHVYLRIMPLAGGEPKVIAYLYGGQGTINVPSWSPDSKRIAFVSNTLVK